MANEKPRKRYGVREVVLAVVGIAVLIWIIVANSGGSLIREELIFADAPEIEFELPNGDRTALSRMRGSTLLINFWASWCAPCMEEMPSLKMLQEHYKDRGLVVLAFNISESREQIRGKVSGGDLPENVIFNFNKEFLRPYDINSVPITLLVDPTGVIRQTFQGPRNWLDMNVRREIERYLSPQ